MARAKRVLRWEQRIQDKLLFPTLSPGCLLTIILLMWALDPLLYEKETLQYFQTLKASWTLGMGKGEAQWEGRRQLTCISCWPVRCQAVDPMRAAYLDDLRSKFLLENSMLKMEYAEVRVLHLGHKVWTGVCPLPWACSPPALPPSSQPGQLFHPPVGCSRGTLCLASPCPWLCLPSPVPFWTFFLTKTASVFLQAHSSSKTYLVIFAPSFLLPSFKS